MDKKWCHLFGWVPQRGNEVVANRGGENLIGRTRATDFIFIWHGCRDRMLDASISQHHGPKVSIPLVTSLFARRDSLDLERITLHPWQRMLWGSTWLRRRSTACIS